MNATIKVVDRNDGTFIAFVKNRHDYTEYVAVREDFTTAVLDAAAWARRWGYAVTVVSTNAEAAKLAGEIAGRLGGIWTVNTAATVYIVAPSTRQTNRTERHATIRVVA